MIIGYSRDGEQFNEQEFHLNGFELSEKDFRRSYLIDNQTGEELEDYNYTLNFVGFLINKDNDVYSVFPKNFVVKDLNEDSSKLFYIISKHLQKRPELYIGDEYGKRFVSNYPFAAFFEIYDYYKKFGLHFEDKKIIKPNIGGKVNWKETIRLSNKYLIDNHVSIFPIYYEKNYYFSAFLTECMIFVINYTIEKFNFLIDLEKIDKNYSLSFLNDKEFILEKLFTLRQQTFKDNLLNLIDNLINFFSELQEGGIYYLKHYSFSSIWEDMVMAYLKLYFLKVDNNKVIFGNKRKKEISFLKLSFRPNLANNSHYFTPDYYYADDSIQYIFDAKYYKEVKGIDYKQLSYFIFLNEYRDDVSKPRKYSKTYSALFLPGEKRESKIHFKMDPKFNKTYSDLIIFEEYLDIREIIDFYSSY